ncbi:MAG: cupredoxin domain-containing protein [Acidimicrobiia bacterium]|nr:cupredoxin domain-containing protein [Acidimicrobiia bacterium]MDH3469997.1 cupredoxin domain-containing protein [Acidimicrobiia bacterium]
MSKKRAVMFVGIALLMAVGACSSDDDEGAATSIEAITTEFAFNPDAWTVAAGEEITIEVTNDGSILHEWVLLQDGVEISSEADLPATEEELLADFVYVEEEIEPGETKTLKFEAPAAGTYQIICALDGHFDAGMEGSLTVSSG